MATRIKPADQHVQFLGRLVECPLLRILQACCTLLHFLAFSWAHLKTSEVCSFFLGIDINKPFVLHVVGALNPYSAIGIGCVRSRAVRQSRVWHGILFEPPVAVAKPIFSKNTSSRAVGFTQITIDDQNLVFMLCDCVSFFIDLLENFLILFASFVLPSFCRFFFAFLFLFTLPLPLRCSIVATTQGSWSWLAHLQNQGLKCHRLQPLSFRPR